MKDTFRISVRYLKGIGPKRANLLNKLGIMTVEDMFYYFPRRYEDRTKLAFVSGLIEGEWQSVRVKVLASGDRRSWRRPRFAILEAAVGDQTGKLFCVWFNQGYIKKYLEVGATLILYGKVERYGGRLQMSSPEFEVVDDESSQSLNINRIVPVYSCPEGITQRYFRQIMKKALDEYLSSLQDFLSFDVRSRNNLLNIAKSLLNIHFPEDLAAQQEAYRRLSFEEFLLFQIPLVLRKLRRREDVGIAHNVEGQLCKDFIRGIPFKLTQSQEGVIEEIKRDMGSSIVMRRLLQGDVGSGKTVVAVIASLFAIQSGCQVAFMVPTEILAMQHYEKISCQLSHVCRQVGVVSCQSSKLKIGLLTSSLGKEDKERVYQEIKDGEVDLVIGTHALLEESAEFKNLGLVVIDEQHKFGVGQRALLPKKGAKPDVLIMTATPIPRTLAITIYGDLDISVINQLPPGRLPVKTMHFEQADRAKAYGLAIEQLKKGNQVYIIYPVIEESYALDIDGAKKMYERLRANEFKEYNLGLIHGKLKQKSQDELMFRFKNKKIDVLVATTILEVGIDIPSATCIIIEEAQRFGLSSLHQLRGRVGRSNMESFCLLISGVKTEDAKKRLEAMVSYSDGFKIAEEDLRIRGPGEFFGSRQHGLSELKIGNPLVQMHLLKSAREEAIRLISEDTKLSARANVLLKEKLLQRFPEYEKLMIVG